MLTCGGIEQRNGQPVIAGQNERAVGDLQVGRFDVFVELAEIDGAVVLITRAPTIRNLNQKHHFALAACLQIFAIQGNFDCRHKALVK